MKTTYPLLYLQGTSAHKVLKCLFKNNLTDQYYVLLGFHSLQGLPIQQYNTHQTSQPILLGDEATVQTSHLEANISELRALLPTRGDMEVMRRMLQATVFAQVQPAILYLPSCTFPVCSPHVSTLFHPLSPSTLLLPPCMSPSLCVHPRTPFQLSCAIKSPVLQTMSTLTS